MGINSTNQSVWPKLAFEEWKDTLATLHMWTQIVGKIRLVQSPLINHWWNVTLLVTPRGLTTGPIPYLTRSFQIDFDFIDHQLVILIDDGTERKIALRSQSVADFYNELMSELNSLGLAIKIYATPVEIPDPIPFPKDHVHATYQAEHAETIWRILLSVDRVFKEFRSRFIGKSSPVHFFWGSFDIAVSRFSGRLAPERPGADSITREAYSHEVISHGFWPGGGGVNEAAFYSYTSPEPDGLKSAVIKPQEAGYNLGMSEFILMYEDVRSAEDPDSKLMEFLQSTYEAGANLAGWDRASLERKAT
ncbi:MAG: hypothetical protein QOH96_294 [Blastocatellia bacterium]|jgi:hypothetical protein|nr:hypothetical protein [Blastocatellia bacterium]